MTERRFSTPVWRAPDCAAPLHTPLEGEERVDLLVVGGGLLGLSTALHAARRGLATRVLEANRIGTGASGLNGGQVIPGLKLDPADLVARFGPARGEALIAFAGSTADAVFDLIARENLAVPHRRAGWIQAAPTYEAMRALEARDAQWRARGADCALLDARAIAALTGTRLYAGGWLDRRAGVVDPLALTLELARVAVAAGAKIAEGERALALGRREGRWRVRTASGEIDAQMVVVAANADADGLVPGLAESLVPVPSFQVATEPLPAAMATGILPEGQAVSDLRRIPAYYRMSPDGRFVFGGRGVMREPRGPGAWRHIEFAMRRAYPILREAHIALRWRGAVALTTDHLPHIHEPEPGLVAAAGCQGRGVALMTALGERLAAYCAERDPDGLPLPITPIRPIPFHRFHRLGVAAAIAAKRALDAMDRRSSAQAAK